MERLGFYDEYQRNPKLFQCKLDSFVELCFAMDVEEPDKAKACVESFVVSLSKHTESEIKDAAYQKKHPVAAMFKALGKNLGLRVLDGLPYGDTAIRALKDVVKIVKTALLSA